MTMPLSDCAAAAGPRRTVSCFFYYLPHSVACILVEALCFTLFFYYNSGSKVAVPLHFFQNSGIACVVGRSVCVSSINTPL